MHDQLNLSTSIFSSVILVYLHAKFMIDTESYQEKKNLSFPSFVCAVWGCKNFVVCSNFLLPVSVTMAYFRDSKMENRNAIGGEKIFHSH